MAVPGDESHHRQQRDRGRRRRHGGGAAGLLPGHGFARQSEGPAEEVGRHLAGMALRMRAGPGPNCLVSGGEPVVRLVEKSRRGLGGRSQQLVLAALIRWPATPRPALRSVRRNGRRGRPDRRRRRR